MRAVVTGGAGFIGSHLVDKLMEMGHEVIVIDDLSSGRIENISRWLDSSSFKLVRADLSRPGEWARELTGVEIVYHFAANPEVRVSTTDPEEHFRANVQATFNVLEAMRKWGAGAIVFASSSTVYGEAKVLPTPEDYHPYEPISVYGASKLACEVLISTYSRLYGMRGASLRLANVVGPRSTHGVIFDFINKLRRDRRRLEILGDGTQRKSYVHVSDVVDATVMVAEYVLRGNISYEAFNVGSPDTISVIDIARIVIESMGLEDVELAFRPATPDGRGWPGDVKVMHLDISKIIRTIGWRPRLNSYEAVKNAVEHYLGGRS